MFSLTHRSTSWFTALAVAMFLAIAMGVTTIVAGSMRGPIPPRAFPVEGGPIDRALVPAFIPALDRDGNEIGWISRDLAVPIVDDGTRAIIPVVGDDLRTVVGHMVAGYGFAPLGTDVEPLLDALPRAPFDAGAE